MKRSIEKAPVQSCCSTKKHEITKKTNLNVCETHAVIHLD